MALTPFRWIAALIAGALISAVVIFRDNTPRRTEHSVERDLSRTADVHAQHATGTAAKLRLAQLMDSLHVGATPDANTPAVRVLIDPGIPATSRAALDSLGWRAVRIVGDSAHVGVDIVYVLDTLSKVRDVPVPRYRTSVDYVLPRRRGERCTAIAHMGQGAMSRRQLTRALQSQSFATQLIGPCAYYAAFGMPGARVDDWFVLRGFAFVGNGSWRQTTQPLDLSAGAYYPDVAPWRIMPAGGTSLPYLFELSTGGVRCSTGDLDACAHAVLTRSRAPGRLWNGNVLYQAYPELSAEGGYWYEVRPFGHRESTLLAAMVRSLGRERFARFWTSNETVSKAFEDAAGEPLDQWASHWLAMQYGPVPPRGAGVAASGWLLSGVLIISALLLAARVSRNRQFA